MSDIFAAIGIVTVGLPLILGLLILGLMWRAWWLYPAWGWFLVPLGVPAISFWHFTALSFLVSTLTMHTDDKKDDRKTDWNKLAMTLCWPIFTWAILRWMR